MRTTIVTLIVALLTPGLAVAQSARQLSLREELRLGQDLAQGPTFSDVVSIVPRADGSFYVIDAMEKSSGAFSIRPVN